MAVMALEEAPAVLGEVGAGSEGAAASSSSAASSIRGDTAGTTARRSALGGGPGGSGPGARGRSGAAGAGGGGGRTRAALGGAAAGGILARKKGNRRTWAQAFDSMSGKTNGGPLLAEYMGGVVIICLGTLTQGPSKGYTSAMSELLLRLTALTFVFFILFLLAGSKAGKAAVWFGLLVDLGILFTATNQNVLKDTATLLSSSSTGGGSIVLTSAGGGGNLEQPEPPPAVVLPEGTPEGTGTTTA